MKVNSETCQAAMDAGYWICRDHDEWFVGHGVGPGTLRYPQRYKHRKDALAAMVAAAMPRGPLYVTGHDCRRCSELGLTECGC
jgi:hypothetical protein